MFRDRHALWFGTGAERESRYGQLFRSPFGGLTVGVALFGLAGMCTRIGGVLGVGVVVAGIAPPTIRGAALFGAIPVALAALAVGRFGIETRRRGLEEITAVELRKALEAR
jgi:hypothetical protein